MKTPSLCLVALLAAFTSVSAQSVDEVLSQTSPKRGILCLAGLPDDDPSFPIEVAKNSEFQIYVQSADEAEIHALQEKAEAAGLLGSRIFAATGALDSLASRRQFGRCRLRLRRDARPAAAARSPPAGQGVRRRSRTAQASSRRYR